jgi:hypothetical protein
MKAHFVLKTNIAIDQTAGIFQRQRHAGADALGFQRAVPALDLAVARWIL